jgi:cephalosporin hydroxylase
MRAEEHEGGTVPASPTHVGGRPFGSTVPQHLLDSVERGTLRTRYRGVRCLKSPFDIVLYMQLFEKLRPCTVIEIGTKEGGSAVWFADLLTAHGIEGGRVLSVDLQPPIHTHHDRVLFLEGDAGNLEATLTPELLSSCLRPFLVVEDSSHRYHHVRAVLEFFHPRLEAGDYLVVEDGVLSRFSDQRFQKFDDGPNRAVAEFVGRHQEAYAIDTSLCDFYGLNVTFNPNGWLRRL